jgi:hypothetical protein
VRERTRAADRRDALHGAARTIGSHAIAHVSSARFASRHRHVIHDPASYEGHTPYDDRAAILETSNRPFGELAGDRRLAVGDPAPVDWSSPDVEQAQAKAVSSS